MEQEQEKAAAAALKKEQGALQEYEKFEKTNNALLPNSKSMVRRAFGLFFEIFFAQLE